MNSTFTSVGFLVFLLLIGVAMNISIIFQLQQSLINQEEMLRQQNVTLHESIETQRIVEETRQNQMDELLPVFFKASNQTDRIDGLLQYTTEILADQRFVAKQIRDIELRLETDFAEMRKVSQADRTTMLNNLSQIINLLNNNNASR